MRTKQKEGWLTLLNAEEIRFAELIDASEGLEAIFLHEGRRTQEKRQHETTLEAKRGLKRVQAQVRAVKTKARARTRARRPSSRHATGRFEKTF
jgi:hypothetical protein